jgi:hypothetical protein
MLGVPCEYPVPTGCSTNIILDRFVQLNGLTVGTAVPGAQLKGYEDDLLVTFVKYVSDY